MRRRLTPLDTSINLETETVEGIAWRASLLSSPPDSLASHERQRGGKAPEWLGLILHIPQLTLMGKEISKINPKLAVDILVR